MTRQQQDIDRLDRLRRIARETESKRLSVRIRNGNSTNEEDRLADAAQEMLEACKGVAIMLNTELRAYDGEPWAQKVRAVITKIEGQS